MEVKKSWRIMVTMCSFLVGILLMVQLRGQGNMSQVASADNILPQLVDQDQQNTQLKAENNRLSQELQQLQRGVNAATLANKDLSRATLLAGLEPVTGPGIRITLDDSKQPVANGDNVEFYVIHQEYLQQIVNALWNMNADAVVINGQRVIENTEIFCSGNNIQINGTTQAPPYVISAIGDQHNLTQAINLYVHTSNLAWFVQTYGIQIKWQQVKKLELPGATMPEIKYATPVKE
ncbi:MAG: DUF881 domain-containing protein [Peptococcaceae bacterium]|nr:DUF881 domain-containing protein [Peptococcaceae bacterium]